MDSLARPPATALLSRVALPAGAGLLLLVLAAAAGGCNATSETLPHPIQTVWRVATIESIVWRPKINEDQHRITSTQTDYTGTSVEFEVTMWDYYSLVQMRQVTRLFVRIEQVKPVRRHVPQQEQEYIQRIRNDLAHLAPSEPGAE